MWRGERMRWSGNLQRCGCASDLATRRGGRRERIGEIEVVLKAAKTA
jgi:hypothetical protein